MSVRSKILLFGGLMLLAGAYILVIRITGPILQLSISVIEPMPAFGSRAIPFLIAFGGLSILLLPFSLIRDCKKRIRKVP